MGTNLFITGRVRTGKSMLISTVIKETGINIGGYFVQRLISQGITRAFRLADISCEAYIPDIELCSSEVFSIETFSNVIGILNDNIIWHPEVFDEVGVSFIRESILKKKPFILMDELGRIELKAPHFQTAVFNALESQSIVLGILKQEDNEFLNAIRKRKDVIILDLNYLNYKDAYNYIYAYLKEVSY